MATGTLIATLTANQSSQVATASSTGTNSPPSGQVQTVVLANGANTITVPATPAPAGVLIQLNASNTQAVTLKGVTGDTGVALGTVGFCAIYWGAGNAPASFVLNSAAAQTGLPTYITFL